MNSQMLTRNKVYSCSRCNTQCVLAVPLLKKVPRHYYSFCNICNGDQPFIYTHGKRVSRQIPHHSFSTRKTDKFVCLGCSTIYNSGKRYHFYRKMDKSTVAIADLRINCGRCNTTTQFRPVTQRYYAQLSAGTQQVNLATPIVGSVHSVSVTHSPIHTLSPVHSPSPVVGSLVESPLSVREMTVHSYSPKPHPQQLSTEVMM